MEEDLELIHRAQAGDKKAFGKLIKKYEKTVYSFAFKICRDKEKAEEAMQETFIKFLPRAEVFLRKLQILDVAVPHRDEQLSNDAQEKIS